MRIRIHILLAVLLLTMLPSGAQALVPNQGSQPPVDPNGSWAEVVNPDGSINSNNLTDGGVITQNADWMPQIPLVGPIPAEYHVYYTPSGNSVVMPTATTLFFMAANAQESGYTAAASTLGTSGLTMAGSDNQNQVGVASLGAFFGSLIGNQEIGLPSHTSATDFFNQVVSGTTDIWSLSPSGLMKFLTSLAQPSLADGNLYSYMLLYTPGQCAMVPGGCTAAQMNILTSITSVPPTVVSTPPPPEECPSATIQPGIISASARMTTPAYPLVVGQDPDRRGVDVVFSASVSPTRYTYYTSEPEYEKCKTKPCGPKKLIGYTCEQHVEVYSECIASASAAVSLSRESRDWILNELAASYPEAYIHHPSFSFNGAGCTWSAAQSRLPVADPGNWNMLLNGRTTGTPVSGPRSFSSSGIFSVYLKETRIIK